MNTLLIFFAIPIAVIILSIILETFIRNPLKVGGIFFSIFIVVAFALGGTAELIVAAIVYTILSIITAFIVELIISRRYYSRRVCPNFYREDTNGFEFSNNNELTNFNSEIEEENNFNTCPRVGRNR